MTSERQKLVERLEWAARCLEEPFRWGNPAAKDVRDAIAQLVERLEWAARCLEEPLRWGNPEADQAAIEGLREALDRIEAISDRGINAEHYSAESAIGDLNAIRAEIAIAKRNYALKRTALAKWSDHD